MHLSPAALDAATWLLEEPAERPWTGRDVQSLEQRGDGVTDRKTINESGG